MNTKTKTDADRGDVEEQLRVIRDDVATLTELLKELGQSRSEEAREAVFARASELRAAGEKAADAARARAESGTASVERAISENPIQSALLALGAGVLLGWMSRR